MTALCLEAEHAPFVVVETTGMHVNDVSRDSVTVLVVSPAD